jgi:hypothetical protein
MANMQLTVKPSNKLIVLVIAFAFCLALPSLYATPPPQSALSTGSPTSPPAAICGNASILNGPSSPPPGAVTISTSQNIQGKVNNYPNGTIFYIESGIHYVNGQIIPKQNDTFIGAPGAILDGQYAVSYAIGSVYVGSNPLKISNVTIEYLTIQNFGTPYGNAQSGVINPDPEQKGWVIAYDTIRDDDGAGVMDSTHDNVSYDCITEDGQYGFQALDHNWTLTHDEISWNDMDNFGSTPFNCGCSGGGKAWVSANGIATNDYFYNNIGPAFWADTNNRVINVSDDYFLNDIGEAIIFEISYNSKIYHDTLIGEGLDAAGNEAPGFATPAIYINQAGGSGNISNTFAVFQIMNNTLLDNVGGIVVYSDSDRYCTSSEDPTTCTIIDKSVANLTSCKNVNSDEFSENPALVLDCIWWPENVLVANNYEVYNKTHAESGCKAEGIVCGYTGLFSLYGVEGYQAWFVANKITRDMNNTFNNNTYVGKWLFDGCDQGEQDNFTVWQSRYGQDLQSLYSGPPGMTGPEYCDQ